MTASDYHRVDKNNRHLLLHGYKPEIALLCIATMLAGFLGARALASIGMILFGFNAVRGVSFKEWGRQRWWLFGLVWVLLFSITYFWSADKDEWFAHIQVKFPFLFLPLSFGLLPAFNKRHIHAFTVILFGFLASGCCWSLFHFFKDRQQYIEGYGVSHLIPTPAYGDHIAFSAFIAIAIIWGVYQLPFWRRGWKITGIIIMLFFAVYLHILAAKTGLVCLYIFFIAYTIYLFTRNSWKYGLSILCVAGILLFVAIKTIPTFQKRLSYIQWAADRYKEGEHNANYGDISRLVSYKVASRIVAQYPVTGIGAGDMLTEMVTGYDQWYPQVALENRLIPHNQFITFALAAGIPTAILFTIWMFAPLRRLRRTRNSSFFFIIWLVLLVPLLIDPFLEVQWGVLVYLLPLLWCRKIMLDENRAAPVT